ncbi:hypothetical protein CVT25_004770 [Psilocybe cyanescens]|uniref:Glycoside hydrolase 131 catalytic N-terminal domain-containing protein n=1 Tax=Psilocybe cyanescens TaxID=93625 RepID=A0A409VXZ8_PSICY|nr:hypothetical protein CVT25_004770 [Psilocybe cyanescens]
MTVLSFILLSTLGCAAFASPAPSGSSAKKECTILFDGRVPQHMTPADFDKNSSIFDHQFVHGQSGDPPQPQVGFRRSELIPATNNGSDITVQGTTTFHWSIRNDPLRPLNFSHEYHPAWHETADFSTSEITFLTGKPFNQSFDPTVHDPKTFRLAGRQSNSPETTFFQTSFEFDVWHNFAVTLGWTSNTLTVYYSKGIAPLKKVAGPAFNDNSGGGQFHTGVFKEPTGPLGIDVLHEGFQESNLNEGLIFGGIFIEDSTDGCVTTFPSLL